MNRFLLIVLSVVGLVATTGAQSKQGMNKVQNSKTLVAYFSATGTTARAAEKVAKITRGELYAITPAQAYTPADLDWNDSQSRSSVEMSDPKSRPALKGKKENIADYDVIFIGYPIRGHLPPRILNTSNESHDLKGKTVIPFATSGSSATNGSEEILSRIGLEGGSPAESCR